MKLNREQIIKALECHIKRRCYDCPIGKEDIQTLNRPCSTMIAENALSLINELTADNEILRTRIVANIVIDGEKLEEIKNECLERVELDIKAIQAETVRKMQARLLKDGAKSIEIGHFDSKTHEFITLRTDFLDQIVKEMLEGDNEQ